MFDNNAQPLQGGLAAWSQVSEDPLVQRRGAPKGIEELRKARGPYPFYVKQGVTTGVVFLSDIVPVPAFQVVSGVGKSGYPDRELIGTDAFAIQNGQIVRTGQPDTIGRILGDTPRLAALATVLDLTPYVDREQRQHTFTRRLLITDQKAVIDRIINALQIANQNVLPGAYFRIMRSNDQRSSRMGDNWNFVTHVTPEMIQQQCPGITQEDITPLDLAACCPILNHADQFGVLENHARVIAQHPDAGHAPDMTLLAALGRGDLSAFVGGASAAPATLAAPTFGAPPAAPAFNAPPAAPAFGAPPAAPAFGTPPAAPGFSAPPAAAPEAPPQAAPLTFGAPGGAPQASPDEQAVSQVLPGQGEPGAGIAADMFGNADTSEPLHNPFV